MDDEQEWEDMCNMSITRTLQRILDSSSDEEEVVIRGGSRPGKAANRRRCGGHCGRVWRDADGSRRGAQGGEVRGRSVQLLFDQDTHNFQKSNRWRTLGWNRCYISEVKIGFLAPEF